MSKVAFYFGLQALPQPARTRSMTEPASCFGKSPSDYHNFAALKAISPDIFAPAQSDEFLPFEV